MTFHPSFHLFVFESALSEAYKVKTKLNLLWHLLPGSVVFNAPWALSNATSTEEVLSRAMAGAMQQVDDYRQKREDDELAKLPNIMDCRTLQWMQSCTKSINKPKNPNAPIRVTNPAGVEFNFVPARHPQ